MEPVARSVDGATDGSPVGDDPVSAAAALGASIPTPTECLNIDCGCNNPPTETHSEEKSPDAAVADLEHTFMCVMHVLSTEGNDDLTDDDYAPSVTELDYTAPNVKNPIFVGDQQRRLDEVLKKHEAIMILSGNVLPPPAYGVVCDIDVQGHAPIKQRARRILLRHLQKLYELLKGLLKAGPIAFSDSPWASPIVIVLKKNGQDIRLCIDYKMVNAVTAIMEYAMPLVDDLLTELENYLWFCSLDAASGFWAIMMTMRARKISVFVCALGYFGWLRMPFGLTNAPMIYQRMIDNALWGFVQPKGGWKRYDERMKLAEKAAKHQRSLDGDSYFTLTTTRTKFEADRHASSELDPVLRVVKDPYTDMFGTNEPAESSLVPVFQRRSFVDGICFSGTTFDDCLDTLDQLLARFEECRISVSFTKIIFCQSKVDFLSNEVSPEGIRADPKKMTAITKLPFPKSKKGMQQFLGSLNYYSRFIQDFAVYGAALYQLKEEDFYDGGDLAAAKESFFALQRKVADAPFLRHFDDKKERNLDADARRQTTPCPLLRTSSQGRRDDHSAEKEVLALLLLLKVCYTQLAGKTLHVYTRFSTLGWVHKSKSLFGRVVQFAVLLSPWQLEVQRVREKDCVFTQLLQSTITNFVNLDDSLALVAPPTKGSPSTKLDPSLLYAQLPHDYEGFVVSFDGSAKTEKNGGYGSCSWIVWKLPEWQIVIAASAYIEQTTVIMAEYSGMNHGVIVALEHVAEDLVIVGDSRLAIQQSLGVIACRKDSLMTLLHPHREVVAKLKLVRNLHVVREYNAAADSLAGEALESKVSKVVLNDHRKTELKELNRIQEMIYEPSSDEIKVENASSESFAQIPDGKTRYIHAMDSDILLQRKTYADCAHQERAEVSATTRSQTKTKKKRVHFENEVPEGTTNTEATEAVNENSETQEQRPSAEARHELTADDIDPVTVQEERRIAKAQDEEFRGSNLKAVLRGETTGETTAMTYKEAREAWKWADNFVLSSDNVLYYTGVSRRKVDENQPEMSLRLVVPTTMIQEVLYNCHDSVEGGHHGVVRFYQSKNVEKHVKSCLDCGSSKSLPQLRGYSPGNVLAERPFQVVSMDFVIPLPRSRRGNTALLLWHCSFTWFIIAKAMSDTDALTVVKVFEERIYRRFGAPSLVRHDRDPRFMSEVFQAFAELIQARSRSTLSYRPQANGQQERSVKTVMQSVKVYVEDPLQQDWDEIAERLVFAINNSHDMTRKETPLYL
ncbi:LOW QUALITY PROTEIN: reverse transcriptase, partial [Phytophthora megakarya]